jgi:Transposase DDE domain group 1
VNANVNVGLTPRHDHVAPDLLKQRLFGPCLGYEDLNDHDWLRHDALLAAIVGKEDPEGNDRESARDRGKALVGKSTLNRLELTRLSAAENQSESTTRSLPAPR